MIDVLIRGKTGYRHREKCSMRKETQKDNDHVKMQTETEVIQPQAKDTGPTKSWKSPEQVLP